MIKALWLVASVIFAGALAGCALRPYENPVQQGINLNPAQIAQLQTGMTQNQVSYLLGTPNLVDPYNANTWYYMYTNQEDHQPRVQHQLSIQFDAAGKVTSFQDK